MKTINVSIVAHNDAICRRLENALNSMIDLVKENGGQIWLQSENNKEHFYELTERVSVNYYMPMSDGSVRVDMSTIRDSEEE